MHQRESLAEWIILSIIVPGLAGLSTVWCLAIGFLAVNCPTSRRATFSI